MHRREAGEHAPRRSAPERALLRLAAALLGGVPMDPLRGFVRTRMAPAPRSPRIAVQFGERFLWVGSPEGSYVRKLCLSYEPAGTWRLPDRLRGRRQKSQLYPHSTIRSPTAPPNSSEIERRPGGTIHLPPSILKFI